VSLYQHHRCIPILTVIWYALVNMWRRQITVDDKAITDGVGISGGVAIPSVTGPVATKTGNLQ
jgi:hypothetical protein